MKNPEQISAAADRYLLHTYSRSICLDRGVGSYVFDTDGKRYLDLIGGIATCTIGHSNKILRNAVAEQLDVIINPSNLFYTTPQIDLAKKLSELSGLSKCFFSNSGTEANEAAIKLARKHTGRKQFICMKNGFHGRTMGSLSATWEPKYKEPFAPVVEGFLFTDYGDADQIRAILESNDDIAGVMLEAIQGEAGVLIPPAGFLREVRDLCRKHGCMMILDEVQAGNGRTGRFFCYQHELDADTLPDIVTAAKGMANGLPIGVTMAGEGIDFEPGDHGCTFGGNPLCCTAALKTIEIIEALLPDIRVKGEYFRERLLTIAGVKSVRGRGLMIGVEVDDAAAITERCADEGLLLNCARGALRMLPPMTISREEMDEAVAVISKVIEND